MLKSILASLFLLTGLSPVFSQIKKGTRMAGATIATAFYNSGKSEYSFPPPTAGYTSNVSGYGLNITPSLGWFISDNTAVGVSLLLNPNKTKTSDVSDVNGNTFNKDNSSQFNFGFGGFVRNYFKTDGKMLPFGQFNLNAGIGSASSKGFYFSGGDKFTYNGKSSGDFFLNTGFSFGLTKMLNANTGLDFFAGYNYSYTKSTFKKVTEIDNGNNGSIDSRLENNPTRKFSNHGVTLGVSFQIFLDKKK